MKKEGEERKGTIKMILSGQRRKGKQKKEEMIGQDRK